MKDFLQKHGNKYSMIIHALDLELNSIKTKCIWLFSFLFDGEKIRRAKSGFDANTRDSIANAFELVEMTVPKEYSAPFIALFELHEHESVGLQLKKFFNQPILNLASLIKNALGEQASAFSDWTKASLLYTFRDQPELIKADVLAPYLHSDNLILKETALSINERNHLF
jgi:hypothetical protein